jgi:hypothetical protein
LCFLGDATVALAVLINTGIVGAALGVYGAALLPYLPHLPLEWGGLAAGAAGWRVARREGSSARARLLLAVLAGVALLAAALLEVYATPHR